MDSCAVVEKQTTYELDKTGFWGEVVRRRQAIVENDFSAPNPLKRGYPAGHVSLKNFLSIPVFQGEDIVAVIGVANKNGDYSENDINKLEFFAKSVWSLILRKQAEIQLQHAREMQHIQCIIDAVPIPMFYNDTKSTIVECNEAFENIFGLDKSSIIGRNTDEFFHYNHEESQKNSDTSFHFTCDNSSSEYDILSKDNKTKHVLVNTSVYTSPDGVNLGYIGVVSDVTEIKSVEKSLRKALDFNETILANATTGVAVYSATTGQCILANAKLARILGGTVESLLAHNFRTLPTWQSTGRLDIAEQVLKTKIPFKMDKEFVSSFGINVFLECTLAAIETGGELYLLRIDKDISDQKRLENEAKDQLAFMKTLVDAVPSPIYYKDTTGKFMWCNHAYEQIQHICKDDITNKSLYDITTKENADFHAEMERAMYETGESISYEGQTITFSGEVRDIIFSKAPFSDSEGHVKGLIGVMTDITERKRAEDELWENEATFRKILSGIRAGIIIIDPDTFAILDINEEGERILGRPSEELVGQPCTMLKWVREKDGAIEESNPSLQTRFINEEYRFEHPDGTVVPVVKSAISVSRSGKILFFEILFDLTNRKTLERQLALAQRLESIGGLAAGIAHEINTPIQYIGDNLSFLENAFTDLTAELQKAPAPKHDTDNAEQGADLDFLLEEIPKALGQSREGVAHVADIVRAMKRFSHMGGEEKSLLDVPKAIQNTIMISRNEWKYHSEIKLDLDPAAQFLPCFPADFNQMLLNIIVNASHAITSKYKDLEEKGIITIHTKKDGDEFEISVTDTGCGIAPKNIHRIYDPFFTTKEVGKGTGQGLAMVHDIVVKKHGGTIDVQSEEGLGTTFTLRFPLPHEGEQTS